MLGSDWRTAGKWSLYARNPKEKFARQAVQAWTDAALQQVEQGIQAAQDTIATDNEIHIVLERMNEIEGRTLALKNARSSLQTNLDELGGYSSAAKISPELHYQIVARGSSIAAFTAGWLETLQQQPDSGSETQDYIPWINHILALIEAELSNLEQELPLLEEKEKILAETYAEQVESSLGFSPSIEIEKINETTVSSNQSPRFLIFIGGFLGLLAWLLYQVVRISLINRDETGSA